MQLNHERDSPSNQIEEKIFNTVHLIRASYPGIRLAKGAADAIRRNLILVTYSYARGIKSIIDLIDAKNQVLMVICDFRIDLMNVQRSTSNFFSHSRKSWMNGCNGWNDT